MSELLSDVVHLWYLREADVTAADEAAFQQTLSQDEVARYERFRCEAARRQFLIARGLLRSTLSRYTDVDPADWIFRANGYGKPFVQHPDSHGICFNVSHTKGMVCCVVARKCAVGVDVEWLDRRINLQIADRYFAPNEVAQLCGAPPQRRHHLFLRFWTLKESYIKARGLGLSIPLSDFWFKLAERGTPVITISSRQDDRADRWQFFEHEVGESHRFAVAIEKKCGQRPELVCNPREVIPR